MIGCFLIVIPSLPHVFITPSRTIEVICTKLSFFLFCVIKAFINILEAWGYSSVLVEYIFKCYTSIKECHFEVEEDAKTLFEEAFAKESKVWKECIQMAGIKEGKQKYKINTTKLIIEMLEQAGVKPENIVDSGICTVCHADQIHSHRAEKEKAGRNMGLIALK